jgi:hypothetical protein
MRYKSLKTAAGVKRAADDDQGQPRKKLAQHETAAPLRRSERLKAAKNVQPPSHPNGPVPPSRSRVRPQKSLSKVRQSPRLIKKSPAVQHIQTQATLLARSPESRTNRVLAGILPPPGRDSSHPSPKESRFLSPPTSNYIKRWIYSTSVSHPDMVRPPSDIPKRKACASESSSRPSKVSRGSNSSTTSSARIKASDNAKFRHAAEQRGISFAISQPSPQLLREVLNIIDRDIPAEDMLSSQDAKALQRVVESGDLYDAREEEIQNTLGNLLFPEAFAKNLAKLATGTIATKSLWSKSVPVPQLPEFDEDVGLARPWPDATIGFSAAVGQSFSRKQLAACDSLVNEQSLSYAEPIPSMLFPFLVCEMKAAAGGRVVARNQRLNGAAILLQAAMHLYKRGLGLEKMKQDRPMIFSVDMNDSCGEIYIHWQAMDAKEEEMLYFQGLVREFSFRKIESLQAFRSCVKNLVDYGKDDWLRMVKQNLDTIFEKNQEKRRLARDEAAKATQVPEIRQE